jgi:molecular chaperone DnaK (HSP70)
MSGRLAIDFGTSNTVAALWDEGAQTGRSVMLAELSLPQVWDGREHHYVPSLIHYQTPTRVQVGQQVLALPAPRNEEAIFRWMKTYVANNMKLPRRIAGAEVDFFQAAGDFMRQVLVAAGALADLGGEEVAFTVPVEAYEHYQNWLDQVAQSAGIKRPQFIDEASAAALGYGAAVPPNKAFLVFDFGGGTLDVSIVRREQESRGAPRCRSLGKAGAQVGGSVLDQWLVRDALKRQVWTLEQARPFMPLLLETAERVKITLSDAESADFLALDPGTGAVVQQTYSRSRFEDLLDANGLNTRLYTILDQAEAQARERGYAREHLCACVMIGGSSLIPSVRRLVRARYGELVRCERPFDAVAVGAAAFVAGAGFDDCVRHEYALRHVNPQGGDYDYQTIVPAGTPYPCAVMEPNEPDRRLVLEIKAAREGQTKFGLQIYECARPESLVCGGEGLELVYDQGGSARYAKRAHPDDALRRPFGPKESILAEPPAKKGEPRFEATFTIDSQKRLCITARDKQTGQTLLRDYPMVKLT